MTLSLYLFSSNPLFFKQAKESAVFKKTLGSHLYTEVDQGM